MTDIFKENCKKHGVPTRELKTTVTIDVYETLEEMRKRYPISMEQFLRDMIDYIIEQETD